MKRFAALAFLCLVCLLCAPAAFAEQEDAIPREWEDVISDAPVTAQEFMDLAPGEMAAAAGRLLAEGAQAPLRLAGRTLAVLLLAGAVRSLCPDKGSAASLLDAVVALSVFSLCSASLLGVVEMLGAALESSRVYLAAFIPVFASAMAACGQTSGALVYAGLFFTGVNLIAGVLCAVGLPVTQVCLSLCAAGCVCDVVDLTKLAKLVCKWCKWLLGACATAFTALMTLQSAFAQSADSAALKTGKFLLGSSIPLVGKALSDAMGSVLASLRMLKGSIGFAAVAVIAAAFLPVIAQCVAYKLVFAAGELASGALGSKKSEALFAGLADCAGLYVSMAFFFSFIVVCATVLMVLLGGAG